MASTLNGTGITCSDGSTLSGTALYAIGGTLIASVNGASSTVAANGTYAGSNLRTIANLPIDAYNRAPAWPSIPGTWRGLMQARDGISAETSTSAMSLFVRIS